MSHHHRAQLPVPTGRPYGDGGLERELRHVVSAAGTGALIGAAGAAAVGLYRVRRHEQTTQAALTDTLRVGATPGVATAAAAAVGSLVGRSPLLSMATAFATATAVSYAILEAGGRRREG